MPPESINAFTISGRIYCLHNIMYIIAEESKNNKQYQKMELNTDKFLIMLSSTFEAFFPVSWCYGIWVF